MSIIFCCYFHIRDNFDLAPQNTDLAIEFNLRLRDHFQTLIPYLEKTLPKPYAEQMRAALNAPVLALGGGAIFIL